MPDRPVIANNTPLVALWVLGRLDILRDLYGEVGMPFLSGDLRPDRFSETCQVFSNPYLTLK